MAVIKQRTPATRERRAFARPRMVLRLGLLNCDGKSSFCLVRNISERGVQVKLYASLVEGAEASIQIGEERLFGGTVAWVEKGSAGIFFKQQLEPDTLLRVRQMFLPQRRRASPRAETCARAILRSAGMEHTVKLVDISATGAKIVGKGRVENGCASVLALPGLPPMRAFVRWTDGDQTGLAFETPIPIHVIAAWLVDRPGVTLS